MINLHLPDVTGRRKRPAQARGEKSTCASPSKACAASLSIASRPNPLRDGGDTAGPPASRHSMWKRGLPSSNVTPQSIETRPEGIERTVFRGVCREFVQGEAER